MIKVLIFSTLFCLVACATKVDQVENYYFPIQNFFNEQTDCFVNQNDSTDKSFWKMKTYILHKDTFLQTTISDTKNGITDETIERVSNGNSILISYTLFDSDKEGNKIKSEATILDSVLFKPSQVTNETILWRIGFKDYRSGNMAELSKSRTLLSTEKNKKTFSDQLKFEIPSTHQGYHYSAVMVYEKGKGLISYSVKIPGGTEKNFVLKKRK